MQSCYPLKAKTKDGEYISFNISDIPLYISNDSFILARKENSPIISKGTLYRGCDIEGIFVGDVLEYEGDEFIVTYQRGFSIKSSKRHILMNDVDMSKVINKGNYLDVGFSEKVVLNRKLGLKYRDKNICFSSITGMYSDRAIITGISDLVDPKEIQQSAGLRYEDKNLYFGDFVKGFALHLYKGRPVIKDGDGIFDIAENKYI